MPAHACLSQAAPRDALISDLAPKATRSACFGFAQSMRKWGSAVGAGLVFVLMRATNNNYQVGNDLDRLAVLSASTLLMAASGPVACMWPCDLAR